MGKEPTCNAGDKGDAGSIPGLGRSSGGGIGNPLQYRCLKNPMDRWAWWATVQSHIRTWLSELLKKDIIYIRNNKLSPILVPVLQFLLLFRHYVVFDFCNPHELQHTRLPCPSLSPRVCWISWLLSQWRHPAISSSVTPFSSCNLSQHQGLFQWVGSLHQVAEVLELQHHSFQWIFRIDSLSYLETYLFRTLARF